MRVLQTIILKNRFCRKRILQSRAVTIHQFVLDYLDQFRGYLMFAPNQRYSGLCRNGYAMQTYQNDLDLPKYFRGFGQVARFDLLVLVHMA